MENKKHNSNLTMAAFSAIASVKVFMDAYNQQQAVHEAYQTNQKNYTPIKEELDTITLELVQLGKTNKANAEVRSEKNLEAITQQYNALINQQKNILNSVEYNTLVQEKNYLEKELERPVQDVYSGSITSIALTGYLLYTGVKKLFSKDKQHKID